MVWMFDLSIQKRLWSSTIRVEIDVGHQINHEIRVADTVADIRVLRWKSAKPDLGKGVETRSFLCGGKEIRTPDPLHAMQVLYQLSYTPKGLLILAVCESLPIWCNRDHEYDCLVERFSPRPRSRFPLPDEASPFALRKSGCSLRR